MEMENYKWSKEKKGGKVNNKYKENVKSLKQNVNNRKKLTPFWSKGKLWKDLQKTLDISLDDAGNRTRYLENELFKAGPQLNDKVKKYAFNLGQKKCKLSKNIKNKSAKLRKKNAKKSC